MSMAGWSMQPAAKGLGLGFGAKVCTVFEAESVSQGIAGRRSSLHRSSLPWTQMSSPSSGASQLLDAVLIALVDRKLVTEPKVIREAYFGCNMLHTISDARQDLMARHWHEPKLNALLTSCALNGSGNARQDQKIVQLVSPATRSCARARALAESQQWRALPTHNHTYIQPTQAGEVLGDSSGASCCQTAACWSCYTAFHRAARRL